MAQSFRCQQRERGQGLVEYALILVLVAVVVIAVLSLIGPSISDVYGRVAGTLDRINYCQKSYDGWYSVYRIVDGEVDLSSERHFNEDPGYPSCS